MLALAIRRDGELLVPHGNTWLRRNHRLTLVGSLEDIELAKHRFTESEAITRLEKVRISSSGAISSTAGTTAILYDQDVYLSELVRYVVILKVIRIN